MVSSSSHRASHVPQEAGLYVKDPFQGSEHGVIGPRAASVLRKLGSLEIEIHNFSEKKKVPAIFILQKVNILPTKKPRPGRISGLRSRDGEVALWTLISYLHISLRETLASHYFGGGGLSCNLH